MKDIRFQFNFHLVWNDVFHLSFRFYHMESLFLNISNIHRILHKPIMYPNTVVWPKVESAYVRGIFFEIEPK